MTTHITMKKQQFVIAPPNLGQISLLRLSLTLHPMQVQVFAAHGGGTVPLWKLTGVSAELCHPLHVTETRSNSRLCLQGAPQLHTSVEGTRQGQE